VLDRSLFRSFLATGSFLALALACSHESTPTPVKKAEAAPPKPVEATPPKKLELVVYAAASTRDALQALEAIYEADHPVDLVFNYGASGDLSRQIVAAAKADVFLSADEVEMDEVEAAHLVAAGSRRILLSNQLTVIEPEDGTAIFTAPFHVSQLADPKVVRLSLADVETVPVGRYAKAWLEKTGTWKDVSDRVLPGVDARAALAAVESGGAQAGIVYMTDVARSRKARSVYVVPIDQGPRVSFPVAAIAGRPNEKEARAFVLFLASPAVRATFEELGFLFLPPAPENAK